MRFDVLTIFPEYFSVLDISLIGKAKNRGVVDFHVHDLRDWAEGKHLAVDDAPSGGGAGMVMRADIWGKAIDAVLRPGAVLAIPTPSGVPLTQRDMESLASAKQIVVACGRYEGIDARVAEHYRSQNVDVREFSLGDYVLNGGEVAALTLIEGVSRLLDGVVGNPESLAEESHSPEGLLEYPVYTHPRSWRGRDIPAILASGDHARIRRWRRDEALKRTAKRRPDMLAALVSADVRLDGHDRAVLASLGVDVTGKSEGFVFETLHTENLDEVSALASRTFALACPPGTAQEEIDDFVSTNLTADALETLRNEGARICVVRAGPEGPALAYSLLEPDPPEELRHLAPGACYLSKIYADPEWHGSGVSAALLEFALRDARESWDCAAALLGTNRENRRAIRFYKHNGFRKVGRRVFMVGGREHQDYVFLRDFQADPPR